MGRARGTGAALVLLSALAVMTASATVAAASGELQQLHQRQRLERLDAGQEQPGRQLPPRGPQGQLQLQPIPRDPPVPDIARIGLERTVCFGTCPAYTVIIQADGSFTYTGRDHVERMGEHRGTVPRWFLDRVLRYVDEIDFMTIDATFDEFVLDAPSTYTMVEWRGTTHVVLNAANAAPSVVWALEWLIDDMLEFATWE